MREGKRIRERAIKDIRTREQEKSDSIRYDPDFHKLIDSLLKAHKKKNISDSDISGMVKELKERYGLILMPNWTKEDYLKMLEIRDDVTYLWHESIMKVVPARPAKYTLDRAVDIITDDGIIDDQGYLHIKIKMDANRDTIRFLLDKLLDRYCKKKKKRFTYLSKNDLNPYKLYSKVNEGKSLFELAKEETKRNKSDDDIVKAKKEQIRRAFKKAKQKYSKSGKTSAHD